jgi:putative SOS response-associated peptidase YedK
MCGRFGPSYRDIKAVWNLYGNFSFQTRYNIAIAPSQEVPVIIRNAGRNEAKLMKWGLVPSRAPDPSMGQRMINARSETLLEKPSFKQAVQKRRCLVPANGFYEWRWDGKRKIPMWILFKTREPCAFPWAMGLLHKSLLATVIQLHDHYDTRQCAAGPDSRPNAC